MIASTVVAENPARPRPGAPSPVFARAVGLAVLSASLSFLAFPGFGLWPLAFVSLVPLFYAMDVEPRLSSMQALWVALSFGFVGMWGGYYWIAPMLRDFAGLPLLSGIALASLLHLWQGGMMALFAWLYFWLRSPAGATGSASARATPALLAAPLAHGAAETVWPMLFPYFWGNHLHDLTHFIQIADLGGPVAVTMLVDVINVGIFLAIRGAWRRDPRELAGAAMALGVTVLCLAYGAYRIADTDAREQRARSVTVGMPQVGMGILEQHEEAGEMLRRHVEMSRELEEGVDPDLLIWPEGAYGFSLPDGTTNVRSRVTRHLTTPLIFGGPSRRPGSERSHLYNTAFLVDSAGEILGTYDKRYLMAFGEYLPLGETFPVLYDWSPNSGRFTRGEHVQPLQWGEYRLSALICYEDILPGFVRKAVRTGDPHLLVNLTNEAWFGETHEPVQHLALAQFRAVEHHRYLVRSTSTGISAIIDASGRVRGETGIFTTENLSGEIRMLEGRRTLYGYLGDWPGWLSVLAVVYLGWIRPRRAEAREAGHPLPARDRA